MKPRAGIRILLVVALALFALVVGVGSALVEIGIITRFEVESAIARAKLAANLVTSQLGISLANSPSRDPIEVMRGDVRLGKVLKDAQEFTPSVLYILVADTLDHVLLHSNPEYQDRLRFARPQLRPEGGLKALSQFSSILREKGAYEVSVPLLLYNNDFGTVRVGLAASFLRDELRKVLSSHIWKLIVQVVLATAFGVAVSWMVILPPLSRLQTGIDHLQRGDFDYRLTVDTEDELGRLASQINTLSETLAKERERFLAQRSVLASEGDALRRIVDAVDDGLLMVNRERQVVMANRTACRMLGINFSELSGKSLSEALSRAHPLNQMVDRCFSQDVRVDSARLEFKTAEGVRAFLATSQVVGDAPHQEGGIITLRDYGRMREIQNLLDHARILSRLAKMAAGVAHEVRNPLNAMNIHLELLAQGTASSGNSGSNRNHLEIVRREIGRLERVVYGFLKLARLQDLNLTRIDIASFLGELRTLVLPEARMAGLDIVLDLNPQLPEVYGDEEVLRQALLNLLKNAIQASPPGSLPIKVSARPDGALVCLVIEDHGRGMTPEVQAKAFDIYFTTKKDGTGVGLSLVQQAVEMHGGSIDVQSDPDRGATFTVRLPALALS